MSICFLKEFINNIMYNTQSDNQRYTAECNINLSTQFANVGFCFLFYNTTAILGVKMLN